MSSKGFANTGLLLFVDMLLVAASGWIYWLMISKLTTSSEIGQATTIFSLVTLVAALTQLGMEYPLLKKSSLNRQMFGSTFVLELLITFAAIPVILFAVNMAFHDSFQGFTTLAIGMLIISSAGFIPRFALLGLSTVKNVLIADIVGIAARFAAGYALVTIGYGATGILWSYLLSSLIIAVITGVISLKLLGFKIGNRSYFKEILHDALANTPSKLSRLLVLGLSVVLLASFGISDSSIGIFYIALMISIVAGGLASSMAFMVIPASSTSKTDLSSGSARIGLSLSSPLIAALATAPAFILSLIGAEYSSADQILLVLSIAIIPTTIVYNAISKFNNLNKPKQLVVIGGIEIVVFLAAFWFLVPEYQTFGAAISILVAFTASSIPSIVWSERSLLKYVTVSGLAVVTGWLAGSALQYLGVHPGFAIAVSIAASLAVVIYMKNTTSAELIQLVQSMLKRA